MGLQLIAGHGWTEGLAVPIPRGKQRFGLVSRLRKVDLSLDAVTTIPAVSANSTASASQNMRSDDMNFPDDRRILRSSLCAECLDYIQVNLAP
jgi:hypothetical protein